MDHYRRIVTSDLINELIILLLLKEQIKGRENLKFYVEMKTFD